MLSRRAGLLLVCCLARSTGASAQALTATSELEVLRAEVQAERARIDGLQQELERRLEMLTQLTARLERAAAVAETTTVSTPAAPVAGAPSTSSPEPAPRPSPPRFDFYADTLIRLATLHQEYGGCVGCPARTVGRMRLRFGTEGRLAPGVRAMLGLSTGELNDPNSVYQTFGGNLGRKATTFDRGFIVYRPVQANWLELSAGKFPYPWVRSSMTFDVDFYPEGASEKVSFDLKRGPLRNLSVQGVQVVVNEQAVGADTAILGGQGSATLAWRGVSTRALFSLMDVRHPEFVLRAQFDGSDVGVRNTNAIVGEGATSRYLSAFRYANVIVEHTIPTRWASAPLVATVEWQRNLLAASSRRSAASLRLEAGRQQRHGDWAGGWHVFRVEQDAIVSALGESDWRAPSNVLQQRFNLIYTAQEHVQTLFTWYRGRTLDTAIPGAVTVPGIVPGAREPWANRFYFDVLYRF